MPNTELEKLLFRAVAEALDVEVKDLPPTPALILPVGRRPTRDIRKLPERVAA